MKKPRRGYCLKCEHGYPVILEENKDDKDLKTAVVMAKRPFRDDVPVGLIFAT